MLCVFPPEVRAGSSWGGWEGEELHRRNPGWEDKGAGLHPSTDSSLSRGQTVTRGLQSVGREKGGQYTRTLTHR